MHLTNLPTDLSREKLKEQFNAMEPVHWVDFELGLSEAKIRFTTENGAVRGWEKAVESGEEGKFKIGENEITGRVLEGEYYCCILMNIFILLSFLKTGF